MLKKITALAIIVSAIACITSTATAKQPEPTESACQTVCVNGKCMLCCTYGNQTVCT